MPTLISGSTGVNKITDGTIVNADIASGAAIDSSKLSGVGKVLQVVHSQYTTAYYNANSSSRTDIPGFAATITPSSTSSKILLTVHATIFLSCDGRLGIARNGTQIFDNFLGTDRSGNVNDIGGEAGTYLDSPSSTSAVVYQMYTIVSGCGNDVWINRDTSGTTHNGRSGITLMEIAG